MSVPIVVEISACHHIFRKRMPHLGFHQEMGGMQIFQQPIGTLIFLIEECMNHLMHFILGLRPLIV